MTEEGRKLAKLIKKAITDLELTTSEYQEILAQANADGMIDPDEKMLLAQLHQMIADGIVDRVPG